MTAVAAAIGLVAGYVALVCGAHGGSPWPTVILSAPVCLLASIVLGDAVANALAMPLGTAALYGLYAAAFVRYRTRSLPVIVGCHALCATILATMIVTR
jgi:hypothetical protein